MKRLLVIALLSCAPMYPQAKETRTTTGTRNDAALIWIVPTRTFAGYASGSTAGEVYVFTDASASGTCTGGGSARALCRWTGSAWESIGGGGGGTWGSITGTLSSQSDLASALALKATLASPTFTGTPALPTGATGVTQSPADNSTKFATTAYADAAAAATRPSVTNDAQTKAAILPNTAPAAGQLPAGNAGGTAYAPVTVSGDCTLTSAGVLTCTKLNSVNTAAAATASTIAVRNASGELIAANTVATGKTPVATDTTDTLTGKTIDAEGTGNVITAPFKIYIPAAGANQTAAGPSLDVPTANGPTANYYGTAPQAFGGLDFADGASALTATAHVTLPSDWSGTVDLKYIWFSGSTSTNSVVWTAATSCIADTEDLLAPTFNTAQTVTDANLATANTRNSASITGITTTGCAAGETMFLRIGRDPTNGSDTLGATAVLLGIEITIRRAM
jgi:hypothetical protein